MSTYRFVSCENHPEIIRGDIISELKQEWEEEELKPNYGCVCLDVIIMEWMDSGDPVKYLKSKGLYSHLSKLVNSNLVTGTLYRGTDMDYFNLKPGEIIDYSDRLTSWTDSFQVASEDFSLLDAEGRYLVLKIEADQIPGLRLCNSRFELETILAECQLKILDRQEIGQSLILSVTLI